MRKKLPFKQVHLDFHNGDGIPEIGKDFNEESFISSLKSSHADSITLFAKCHHGNFYYYTDSFRRHPHLACDLLQKQFDACRKAGIRVGVYLSAGIDEYYAVNHPDCCYVQKDGKLAWSPDFQTPGYHLLCFNAYTGDYVRDDGHGGWEAVPHGINTTYNGMGWPTTTDVLYYGAKFFYERYRLPILISENGFCASDVKIIGEEIDDGDRISYTKACLRGLQRAVNEGVDVMGYFYWSFTDNIEWTEGYRRRFGLVYVDFATKQRELKRSAHWYGDVIQENGANL